MRRSKLPKIKKGMWAEQLAVLYLINEGYFVFKNLYGVGPADLIAINEKGVVITSSESLISKAFKAIIKASVPLETEIQFLDPTNFANDSSSSLTSGP